MYPGFTRIDESVVRSKFARNFAIEILSAALSLILLCALSSAQKKPPARPIDLNAATIKELVELPGVGPVTAKRIIEARQKSGRFHRVEDLLAIRGISTKRLEVLRPYVTVSSPPPPSPTKKPLSLGKPLHIDSLDLGLAQFYSLRQRVRSAFAL